MTLARLTTTASALPVLPTAAVAIPPPPPLPPLTTLGNFDEEEFPENEPYPLELLLLEAAETETGTDWPEGPLSPLGATW